MDVENLEVSLTNSDDYVRDMLKHYETGWEERGIDDKQQFAKRLNANVVSTITYLNEILSSLSVEKLLPRGVFIRLENAYSLSVTISLSVEDFMSEKLRSIYKKTHGIERKSRSDNYRIAFSFTYDDGLLNEDTLIAEGYVKAK